MYHTDLVTKEKGESIAVGRAAVGIYLILKNAPLRGTGVVVPANLCYAGVYPVLYAGLTPQFCDVDPLTGEVTLETVAKTLTPDTAAVIVPHMYGNPVQGLPEIAAFCREKGLLLVEDCASAMGAKAQGYTLGQAGDYTVYSTGQHKILDFGYGGLVCSYTRPLAPLEDRERRLPRKTPQDEADEALFSRLYRLLRNEGQGTKLAPAIYAQLAECCRGSFLFGISETEKARLVQGLAALPESLAKRRRAKALYDRLLAGATFLRYPYAEGASLWRYNLLAEPALRRTIIDTCLAKGLPVSDWYPQVTPMFGCAKVFPGAAWHEAHILNFPLLASEETITAVCSVLNELLPAAEKT